jgi:CheY-like chemotaxis protein
MKILIADDIIVVQMIMKKLLSKCGIKDLEIKTASNGQEAYELVKSWQPNLVITDWNMPIMSGLELLKKIYANGMNDIIVGIITAQASEKNIEQAKRFGAAFVLGKPCDEEEIIKAVKAAIAKIALKNTSKPVLFNDNLQSVLSKKFNNGILLKEVISEPGSDLIGTHLIALFGTATSDSIKAIVAIDKRGIYLLGGLLNNMSLTEALNVSKEESVDSNIAKFVTDFLTEYGAEIFDSQTQNKNDNDALKIKSKAVAPKLPEKIRLIINSSIGRKDFKLTHPKFGDCFMSIAKL